MEPSFFFLVNVPSGFSLLRSLNQSYVRFGQVFQSCFLGSLAIFFQSSIAALRIHQAIRPSFRECTFYQSEDHSSLFKKLIHQSASIYYIYVVDNS